MPLRRKVDAFGGVQIMREVLTVRMEGFPNRRLRKEKKSSICEFGGAVEIKSGKNL
jgi:hypothetical protein